MLSLDVLLISSLLAMPLAPVHQEPPPAPEPPAQPEPAPEPEPDPEPAPEPEPDPEPNIDEPPSEPGATPSDREIELEEQLAEARARAADLERMIEVLRQQLAEARAKAADLEPLIDALQRQVAQLRAELEDQKLARESRSESQTLAVLEAPSPTAPTMADPAGHSPQDPAAPEPSVAASAGPPADAPSAIRSWDEDPDDATPSWSAPLPTPTPAPTPVPASDSADALVASMRSAYSARFPSIPSPAQRDAFDAFTADVVKWSAAQQRSLRRPVMWTIQFLRVEKGSGRDRMVRFIARSAVRSGPQGAIGTFIVRVPRAEAEQLLKGDYRSGSYEVSGTLTPVVRFAPERPYDGISSTPTAFVGPYCEVSVALDAQSISPGS